MVTDFNRKLLKQTEPYAFQRTRNAIHNAAPRPPQPNTNQPNAKVRVSRGLTTQDYWGNVFKDYMKHRGDDTISPFQLRDLATSISNIARRGR